MANSFFNFYQATGFGTGMFSRPSGWIDYFTGVYFPIDLSKGKTVGFLWPISDVPVQTQITISGNINNSNRDNVSLKLSLGGNIWPLIRESGRIGFDIKSGQVLKDNIDRPRLVTTFSASTSGQNIDRPNIFLTLKSGALQKDNKEITNFKSFVPSGILTSGNADKVPLSMTFYAQFTKLDHETNSVGISIDTITYGNTVTTTTYSATTGTVFSFQMSQIFYSNAS